LNIYLDLFLSFAQAGACTFGGGYAMLPILQREMVQKRHWVTDEELADYYAIGQCTPGIIAVNTATFVGVKQKGTLGGIVATLGVVFPSIVIITVIAAFLRNFADLPVVAHAFAGIRACVCVLIFNAVLKLKKSSVIDLPTTVIFLLTFLLSALWGVSPAIIVLVAGVVGLSITLAKGGLKK
jgi:chromate transporter